MAKTNTNKIRRLMVAHGQVCTYCKRPVFTGHVEMHVRATIDHEIPICRGGDKAIGVRVRNTSLACGQCNNAKDDMTAEEFRFFLSTRRLAKSYTEYLCEKVSRRLSPQSQ